MAPKVPHRDENLDSSKDMDPTPGFEEGSGCRACAEQVALGSRDLCAQGMKIPISSRISILDLAGMVRPDAVYR